MRTVSVFAVILSVVCALQKINAQDYVEEEILGYGEPSDYEAPIEYLEPIQLPKPIGYPQGWRLANSEVMTGGSAKGGKNVLAGGSTSADDGVFTKTKTHSRSRGSSSVDFGMIGGDGGDNNNVQKGGIEYSGGGITNFLSKTQGINNQGVNGGGDLFKYFQGGFVPYSAESSYAPEEGYGYEITS